MYINDQNFGIQVHADIVGEAWISMIEAILKHGDKTSDEGRSRLSIQNIRLKVAKQQVDDPIFLKYANQKNIQHMKELMFSKSEMFDFDVVPSFSSGSKSYHHRIVEGKMYDFVIKRLSFIPERKKAVMVFPTYEDYEQVINNQNDDYLPCLVAFQTRLIENGDGYLQNNTFFMRSWDAFQKAPGNISTMVMLSKMIAEELSKKLNKKIELNSLDGFITDAHIYQETIEEAQKTLDSYKSR